MCHPVNYKITCVLKIDNERKYEYRGRVIATTEGNVRNQSRE